VLDEARLAPSRRAAALAVAGAIALGGAGLHAVEHGYGEPLPTATETIAVCSGRPSQHFDAPRLIEVRPCPACLLARFGLGEPAAPPPAVAALAPRRGLAGAAPGWIARPPAHPRRPRGPPVPLAGT
jgi:hypothetical protein